MMLSFLRLLSQRLSSWVACISLSIPLSDLGVNFLGLAILSSQEGEQLSANQSQSLVSQLPWTTRKIVLGQDIKSDAAY